MELSDITATFLKRRLGRNVPVEGSSWEVRWTGSHYTASKYRSASEHSTATWQEMREYIKNSIETEGATR